MLTNSSIKFLKDLKKNNSKEWFDANRKSYEATKENFIELISAVLEKFGKKDKTISALTAKECMFRQNRDIRFAKDKSPYKTNIGAYICRGGKKSFFAGYYFHFEPGNSLVGGGLWQPEPGVLKKIRQEIDYNFDEFKKVINSKKFTSQYNGLSKTEEHVLSREPKGYEKDNPAIEYLKHKSWVALKPLTDADLMSKDLSQKIIAAFEALQQLVEFFNKEIEYTEVK